MWGGGVDFIRSGSTFSRYPVPVTFLFGTGLLFQGTLDHKCDLITLDHAFGLYVTIILQTRAKNYFHLLLFGLEEDMFSKNVRLLI